MVQFVPSEFVIRISEQHDFHSDAVAFCSITLAVPVLSQCIFSRAREPIPFMVLDGEEEEEEELLITSDNVCWLPFMFKDKA